MKYRANLTDKTGTWHGYGNTDHAAIMDAYHLHPDVNPTQCAMSLWHTYDNDATLIYCSTLSQYFDDIN